jgi:hypothetical protein
MNEPLLLQYRLTKELWRRFFAAHFAAERTLKIRYFWGVVCIVIGALGFAGIYPSHLIAGLLMATGFYGVLSRQILVVKSLRQAIRHPFYGQELQVTLTPEEIRVRSGTAGYSQPWGNFIGYREARPGYMFYHDANRFFFIPREALTSEQTVRLKRILSEVKLARR